MLAAVRSGSVGPEVRAQFIDDWLRSGDLIRDSTGDDLLLARGLKVLLPPYKGPGRVLFRGDTALNRRRRTYGLSWSADE
jgi:hypothetical protein